MITYASAADASGVAGWITAASMVFFLVFLVVMMYGDEIMNLIGSRKKSGLSSKQAQQLQEEVFQARQILRDVQVTDTAAPQLPLNVRQDIDDYLARTEKKSKPKALGR